MKQRFAKAKHIHTHAHKKLRLNLQILFAVYAALFFVTLYNIVISQAAFWEVALAIIIGVAAGLISSRMFKISWSQDEAKVIGKIDLYGGIVLVLFVVFELNRAFIADLFASESAMGAIGWVLLTSALYGRILGTGKKIIHILEKEKLI